MNRAQLEHVIRAACAIAQDDELIPVGTTTGLCLDPHDLFVSKYAAGRSKDRDYLRHAIRAGLARQDLVLARLERAPLSEAVKATIRASVAADFAAA